MSKRKISTSDCQVGDILAEDVLNSSGLKLIGSNSIITDYIKDKLLELNISDIMVYEAGLTKNDPNLALKRDYFENVAAIKGILNRLSSGAGVNYDKILDLSDKVYNGIKLSAKLMNCLNELRDIDEYTYTHSINTAFYVMLIAKWLDFQEKDIKRAIQCGLLHDVGKLLVPAELLNKNGTLTESEFSLMKKHTLFGYELLDNSGNIDKIVKQAALLHHERADGSGYPLSVKANQVGTYARIVAVADVFDAMTSDRIYKKRVTPFEAFRMFKTSGVGLFDPIILNKFLSNIASFYTGMKVQLNNEQIAQIVYIPPHDIVNPVIYVNNEYIDLASKTSPKIVAML